jgi:hypothetical protein
MAEILESANGRGLLNAGYTASWFTNNRPTVTFDNPFRAHTGWLRMTVLCKAAGLLLPPAGVRQCRETGSSFRLQPEPDGKPAIHAGPGFAIERDAPWHCFRVRPNGARRRTARCPVDSGGNGVKP